MLFHRKLQAVCLAACLAGPVAAQEFRAENRVTVTPVSGGFAISNGNGYGARGMWCAAADFARDRLGAQGTDRVYIRDARSPGIGQRAPVVFTLSSAGLQPSGVLSVGASLRTPGANLSVDHAQQFCADARFINR